jgi:hypothetical protein
MSARSSRHDLLVIGLAATVGACGTHAPPLPEADPALVTALAGQLADNVPMPGGAPQCKDADLARGVPMTYRTLLALAGRKIVDDPEHAAWINTPQLDAPAARALVDPAATETAKRQAAATLVSAPSWTVYRIDNVNAPIALAVKELKIGTVGARVIGYDRSRRPSCVTVFYFQNDKAKSDWALAQSDRALIDPAVAQAMKDDLVVQLLAHAPGRGATR